MMVLAVALDVLREASKRRWFLALGIIVTGALVLCALGLRLDIVDGALAATRLFGKSLDSDIRPAEVVLGTAYRAVAYFVFYGGLAFGIVACADFGPELFSPGRIEHLLALPVRRWELLFGTYLGVVSLAAVGSIYGTSGLALVLGVKTGIWTLRPVVAGLLSVVAFSGIYGAMLATALVVRAAPLGAAVGTSLLFMSVLSSHRVELATLFERGGSRALFLAVTLPFPRAARLAEVAADIAGNARVPLADLVRLVTGFALFGVAALALGVWRFEQKDF